MPTPKPRKGIPRIRGGRDSAHPLRRHTTQEPRIPRMKPPRAPRAPRRAASARKLTATSRRPNPNARLMPISLRRSQTEICMVITMPKLVETIRTTRIMVVRARLSFVKEARRVTGEGGISMFVSTGARCGSSTCLSCSATVSALPGFTMTSIPRCRVWACGKKVEVVGRIRALLRAAFLPPSRIMPST